MQNTEGALDSAIVNEKARLVSKLRHARERVRQEKGKCEGRKPHAELRPDAVALCLGLSFGVVAANRGVKVAGL